MFGSASIGSDYTFTQSGNRLLTSNNISGAISSYLGNFGVSKNNPNQNPIKISSSDTEKQTDKVASSNSDVIDNVKSDDDSKDTTIVDKLLDDEDDGGSSFTYDGSANSITTSFDSLAAAVGASNDKVSKTQLVALLQSLSSEASSENSKEIAFIKSLIAKFDTLSNGANYITSFNGVNDIQDYETVTSEQVTSPVDIRI